MTGPNDTTRPISVAELLAKNGTHGAPAPARRRRRRGNSDAVTVAELTGEIPIITDDVEPETAEPTSSASAEPEDKTSYWSEPEPRWPESEPPRPRDAGPQSREPRPQRSEYPRPVRTNGRTEADRSEDRNDRPVERAGAEGMAPDPIEDYAGMSVDVMDTEVRDADSAIEDSAYVRSYLRTGKSDDDTHTDAYRGIADVAEEEDYPDDLARDSHTWSRSESLRFGGMVVLQSILAVGFGGGLFIAFSQLWPWNNIVALVLSILVILGLVLAVRVVRKTEDLGSTLIAVAVGALVTLGPLALLQSG